MPLLHIEKRKTDHRREKKKEREEGKSENRKVKGTGEIPQRSWWFSQKISLKITDEAVILFSRLVFLNRCIILHSLIVLSRV